MYFQHSSTLSLFTFLDWHLPLQTPSPLPEIWNFISSTVYCQMQKYHCVSSIKCCQLLNTISHPISNVTGCQIFGKYLTNIQSVSEEQLTPSVSVENVGMQIHFGSDCQEKKLLPFWHCDPIHTYSGNNKADFWVGMYRITLHVCGSILQRSICALNVSLAGQL